MNIKIILAGLAAVVLVGGGILVATSSSDDDGDDTVASEQQTDIESSTNDSSERNSLDGLLALGRNFQCTFTNTDEGNTTTGTAYVAADERMSGSFEFTSAAGETTNSNLIRDNEYQYLWEDNAGTGFRVALSALDQFSADDDSGSDDSVATDEEFDFSCSDWTVEESRFVPPSSVTFTDFTVQTEQAAEAQSQVDDAIQTACASITDPAAREACESVL